MQRAGLMLLIVGLLAVGLAYGAALLGVAAAVAPWWLASGSTATLAGLAALGAARRGRSSPLLGWSIAIAFMSVAAGLLVPLALPAPGAATPLLLGLPRPTAILLLLVGLVPLVMLPIAYAVAFEREVLSDADLAALRGRQRGPGADEGSAE